MVAQVQKTILIGLDAPIARCVIELAQAGHLPAFKNLVNKGVWAENCLLPPPTMTPPNWTTISTGAWPRTHGFTSFHTCIPGEHFLQEVQSFHNSSPQPRPSGRPRQGKASAVL